MWRTLTEDDLTSAMHIAEKAAYEAAAAAAGNGTLVDDIIVQVTADARSRIAACRDNTLGPAETVPESAIYNLVPLAIVRLLASFDETPSDVRMDEWKASKQWLRDVANCKVEIERPAEVGPEEEQGYGNAVVVRPGDRKARRENMNGLL